jgi:hypothetical protein
VSSFLEPFLVRKVSCTEAINESAIAAANKKGFSVIPSPHEIVRARSGEVQSIGMITPERTNSRRGRSMAAFVRDIE